MKKQTNLRIQAYLVRGAFYLLLLVDVCAVPFALAQSRSRGTAKWSVPALKMPQSVVRASPGFAPTEVIQGHLSNVRTRAAATLASGSAMVKGLLMPMFPGGGCDLGPWSTSATGPGFRYRAGAVSDGTYIYIFGGGPLFLNDLWRWNPATQAWTQLANMPTAKQSIQGAYWNGKIYVPGGFDNINAQYLTENAIYDIATNTWSTGAPLPAPQSGQNVAFNGKIYDFGGNPGPQNTVTIYNIATDTWTTGAPMPVAIVYGRATVAGNFAYYVGGIDFNGTTVNTVYRYDFATDSWATMNPLQTARTSEELMTSPDGLKLFAVMGGGQSFFTGVPLPVSVEIYDIFTNSWSYGNPVVVKAAAPSGGLIGGLPAKAMVLGGVDGPTYYNTVQVSLVPCETPTPTPTEHRLTATQFTYANANGHAETSPTPRPRPTPPPARSPLIGVNRPYLNARPIRFRPSANISVFTPMPMRK
jgi:hypothetical protein